MAQVEFIHQAAPRAVSVVIHDLIGLECSCGQWRYTSPTGTIKQVIAAHRKHVARFPNLKDWRVDLSPRTCLCGCGQEFKPNRKEHTFVNKHHSRAFALGRTYRNNSMKNQTSQQAVIDSVVEGLSSKGYRMHNDLPAIRTALNDTIAFCQRAGSLTKSKADRWSQDRMVSKVQSGLPKGGK